MAPDAMGISRTMQSLGRRFVQYINQTYRRSGTLWEGRHKASVIDADNYLLRCMRYIELNPVRAGMADHPAEYIWSSYRANAQGAFSDLVTPHNCYLALAAEGSDRRACYRELFAHELDNQDIHAIRNAAQFSMPLGSEHFMQQIEDALERSLGYAKRGRPRVKKGQGIAND